MASREDEVGVIQLSQPAMLWMAHLIEPSDLNDKYEANFVMAADHPDLPDIQSLIVGAAKESFPSEFKNVQALIRANQSYDKILTFPLKSVEDRFAEKHRPENKQ